MDYYLVPNLIRKTLETFFAFKFPKANSIRAAFDQKPVKECSIEGAKLAAIERLSQVQSHGDNVANLTSLANITYAEAVDAAHTCMTLIKELDPEHHKQMLKKCAS